MRTLALALVPILLASPASAGEPCQLDEIGTTICTGDNSEYRVIRGTISPDKRYGIAWNTGTGKTRNDYEMINNDGPRGRYAGDPVETFLMRFSDSTMLKKLGGLHYGDAQRYNHTIERAVWSPNGQWLVAINEGKWDTANAETYRITASGVSGPLDLKPLCREAERRGLKATRLKVDTGKFAHTMSVKSIADDGTIAAICWMQIVKGDDVFQFSVKMKADASGKTVKAKLGAIKRCPELEGECTLAEIPEH
jgi:hypothetical protein